MESVDRIKAPVIVNKEFAHQLTASVENYINVRPMWWCEYDFRYVMSEQKAIAEFNNYIMRITRSTKAHILPVASIGIKNCGLPHIHAVICADRRLVYRDVHNWRSGFSEQREYQFGNTGIEYLCDYARGHKYIPDYTPFCRHRGKCSSRGCVYQRGKDL